MAFGSYAWVFENRSTGTVGTSFRRFNLDLAKAVNAKVRPVIRPEKLKNK
jgi:hypothetical protein